MPEQPHLWNEAGFEAGHPIIVLIGSARMIAPMSAD
jgi:hypothetical protein